jgi:hypothetical protein
MSWEYEASMLAGQHNQIHATRGHRHSAALGSASGLSTSAAALDVSSLGASESAKEIPHCQCVSTTIDPRLRSVQSTSLCLQSGAQRQRIKPVDSDKSIECHLNVYFRIKSTSSIMIRTVASPAVRSKG